jgi:carboxypeptidase Taq
MNDSLKYIYKVQKELSILGGISGLLAWDQLTYMPKMGIRDRSNQNAYILRYMHEKMISDKFWVHVKCLSKPNVFEKLSIIDKNVIKRLYKDIVKARKIPSEFVEELARTSTIAYQSWEEARRKSRFGIFSKDLKKLIELKKQYCIYIDLPGSDYNSLLDDFEEGMTVKKLQKQFFFLKSRLIKLIDRIKTSKYYNQNKKIKIDIYSQKKICDIIINLMNLPKNRSRIDMSTHPFTTSVGYDDVRLTTNFERKNPLFSIYSIIHEAGHALYELGMSQKRYKYTVISDSPSLGLHESQSRFWENMIAKSKPFWKYFFPIIENHIRKKNKDIDINAWIRLINQVRPSLIRVEADEVTYNLHIILRFEIELGLIKDEIQISELPVLWNEKMENMLGIKPKNDRDGVLQDMHWSNGSFGYFPTYVIGSIYASQIFKKLLFENILSIDKIKDGDFKNIKNWLYENIYKFGRLMTSEELIKKTCGQTLNSNIYLDYLNDKYTNIYEV